MKITHNGHAIVTGYRVSMDLNGGGYVANVFATEEWNAFMKDVIHTTEKQRTEKEAIDLAILWIDEGGAA